MSLTSSQIREIQTKLFNKIIRELSQADEDDMVDEFLEKYGIELEDEDAMPINTRTYKILVIGELAGRVNDYQIAAKKKGISNRNIDFVNYDEAKCFNVERLRYSTEYSDIIAGPIPHKVKGMGDTSSFISLIEHSPKEYPRLIKSIANSESNQLKISLSNFKDCLEKTQYYQATLAE